MNNDGTMNHFAFDSKPVLNTGTGAVRKVAAKKKASAFSSESDDEDAPVRPQPPKTMPPPVQSKPTPVV